MFSVPPPSLSHHRTTSMICKVFTVLRRASCSTRPRQVEGGQKGTQNTSCFYSAPFLFFDFIYFSHYSWIFLGVRECPTVLVEIPATQRCFLNPITFKPKRRHQNAARALSITFLLCLWYKHGVLRLSSKYPPSNPPTSFFLKSPSPLKCFISIPFIGV